jgi:hypothetical protein
LAFFILPNGEDVKWEICNTKIDNPCENDHFLAYTTIYNTFRPLTQKVIEEEINRIEEKELEHWKNMWIESIEKKVNY